VSSAVLNPSISSSGKTCARALDTFLRLQLPTISRSAIQRLIAQGDIGWTATRLEHAPSARRRKN